YADNLIVIGVNRQAMEILAVPPGTFAAGQPFAKLVRHVAELGGYGGQGSVEARVEKRMAIVRSFAPYAAE
ncbi:MAG: PAS-domain containing protein, partial [Rhodospirillaceae bacterium]